MVTFKNTSCSCHGDCLSGHPETSTKRLNILIVGCYCYLLKHFQLNYSSSARTMNFAGIIVMCDSTRTSTASLEEDYQVVEG